MRESPGPIDGIKRELLATCDALRDHLKAMRVSVWRYDPDIGTISPFVASAAEGSLTSASTAARWMHTPVVELPPLRRALMSGRSAGLGASDMSRGRVGEFFEDFDVTSAWCGPLLLGRPVGLVLVEPLEAMPDRPDPRTKELVTTTAAALAWCYADRLQTEADLFVDLAAGIGHERLGPLLARACEALAGLLGMRRASIFLAVEEVLVPRMSCMVDGTRDAEAWEAFRHPQEPLALVEAVLRSGSPTVADDPGHPLIAGWWSTRFSIGAALAVPIRSGGNTLGVLMVDTNRSRSFAPAHIRLAAAIATQLGIVVKLADERVERDHRLASAAALNELFRSGVHCRSVLAAAEAVARTTKQALGVEVACTYLVDRSKRVTELAAVGSDANRVAELRRRLMGELASESPVWQKAVEVATPGPHLLSEISPHGHVRSGGMAEILGLRCLAAIPLMSSDGPLGVVVCGDTTGPRNWRRADHDLLVQLALSSTIVIDNARLRETERHMATHDELTGLANRRAFADQSARTLAHARRTGERVAILLVDLDRFKQVNDTLGHHQGDALLIEVAQRLRSALRDADLVARLGGDEFAAILTVTEVAGAQVAAARVTSALKAPVTLGDALLPQVQASIGIACWPDHGDTPETLLQRADSAMYAAKNTAQTSLVYDATVSTVGGNGSLPTRGPPSLPRK